MTTTLIRRAGVLALIAATTTALTGCAGVLGAKMTYDDVEKTKITGIEMTGGSGDVLVRTGTAAETSIRRIVRNSSNPGETYKLNGTVLELDTECGSNCRISYEITAPAGVTVKGDLKSGDVQLTGVGAIDVKLTSGNIFVHDATGPVQLEATSGDIKVTGTKSSLTAKSTSGNIEAEDVAGPVDLQGTSGDVDAKIATVTSVRARTTSGNVTVVVPSGKYKVSADTGSGDDSVSGITNDLTSKNVIEVETHSGDATVSAA